MLKSIQILNNGKQGYFNCFNRVFNIFTPKFPPFKPSFQHYKKYNTKKVFSEGIIIAEAVHA